MYGTAILLSIVICGLFFGWIFFKEFTLIFDLDYISYLSTSLGESSFLVGFALFFIYSLCSIIFVKEGYNGFSAFGIYENEGFYYRDTDEFTMTQFSWFLMRFGYAIMFNIQILIFSKFDFFKKTIFYQVFGSGMDIKLSGYNILFFMPYTMLIFLLLGAFGVLDIFVKPSKLDKFRLAKLDKTKILQGKTLANKHRDSLITQLEERQSWFMVNKLLELIYRVNLGTIP